MRMKKIKCIDLYPKNKQIPRNREIKKNIVLPAQKIPS